MVQRQNGYLRILASVLFIVAVICSAIAWYGVQNNLPSGFTVDGWHAGGSSITEFEHILTDKKKLLLQQPVQLISQQPDIPMTPSQGTMEQLGLQVPLQNVLDQLTPLRTGSPFARAVYRWQLRNRHYTIPYEIDATTLHTFLTGQFPALYDKQPVHAQRIVGPTDTISYIPESYVMRIDETALLQRLKEAFPSLGTSTKSAEPQSILLSFVKQEPSLTLRTLQDQGVDRKISEFTTALLLNGEGRLHNIRSTAASIHDLLMKPGDVFDYAAYITQTEAQFGFKEAPVIVNGKLVPGIGGGICQVSSTLYNAVLRAGLSIIERRNHSLPVSYVPLGQDATFAAGHINFKFRNNTEKYLLIRTSVDDQGMTVKLFGQIPSDITYTIESKTVRTLQPEIKYVVNPTLPPGQRRTVAEGRSGYVVDTYRYKKQNGRLIGQERISQDTYAAQPTVIAIRQGSKENKPEPDNGVPPGKPYEAPLIEDGVKGPLFR
jgi:vancomycin resistance protein YoaR